MPSPSRDEGSSSEGKLLTVSSEGNTATSAWKAKQREFTTEIMSVSTSQPRTSLHACYSEGGLSGEAQPSGLGLQGDDWGWLPWRYSEGASTTQLREFREKPGPPRNARDHCHGDPLTLHAHRPQEASFANRWDVQQLWIAQPQT